jgi:hypothetical protein
MSDVKHVLAHLGADNPSDWPLVFAVVVGALALLAGVAWAVVAAAGVMQRSRERKAVAQLLGGAARPTRRRFPIGWGGGRRA